MTIRSAFARPILSPAHLRVHARGRLVGCAANDNADLARHDQVVRDALRHFAAHGLNAAGVAAERARVAHHSGDDQAMRHWLQICAALDPRQAAALHRKLAALTR